MLCLETYCAYFVFFVLFVVKHFHIKERKVSPIFREPTASG